MLTGAAQAQQLQITLDPAATKIDISVHDPHGGVHGSFKLKSGSVVFEQQTGAASGQIVVDAGSGDTGNSSRDHKMKNDVLETERYPEIIFIPKRVTGTVAAQGSSSIQVQGVFRIHGAEHDLTFNMPVQVSGTRVTATTSFVVPYESWGMKNPSFLFLRVDGEAQVSVSAVGKIEFVPAGNQPH